MADNFFGITDTGRQRTNNEDAFIAQKVLGDGYVMACVIDGVGGYEGGEVAAALAKETILHYFSIPSGDILTMMGEALAAANEKIRAEKRSNQNLESMACVVTLAIADTINHRFYYTHVGDTRLYLYRDDALVKITKDHSFVGFLEDNNRLTEEAAMAHPKRNEIDKALGFDNSVSFNGSYFESGQYPFLPGDALLLCSDGLTDLVTNSEMTAILQNNKTLEGKAKALVDAANLKGGKDNITVVLVENRSKSVKQRATKPKLIKKKDLQNQPTEQPLVKAPEPKVMHPKKSSKTLLMVLSLLCVVLLATVVYLLWPQITGNKKEASPDPIVLNEKESLLGETINQLNDNRLSIAATTLGDTIFISDTLHINKDTLYLNGNGRTVLVADSSFAGPALAFLKGFQNIFLDSITFQNFDVALLAQNAVLNLKGVRFVNCRVPVQYQYRTADSSAVNGVIKNQLFSISDTLIKSSKQSYGARQSRQ
jgi:serine/threonine protein phosphatase PrpC